MSEIDPDTILLGAKKWFSGTLVKNHIKNTKKLISPKKFKINPFTISYLSKVVNPDVSPETIATALILPRVLGTSISTSFGSNMQKFITTALPGLISGSSAAGLDIEFVDKVDGRKKYCQIKAGPDTLNSDDVVTIHEHFNSIRGRSKTNNLKISNDDLIVGVLYGEHSQLSANYKKLESRHYYPIYVGKDFWHRLTGQENFYEKLLLVMSEAAAECEVGAILNETIKVLAKSEQIQKIWLSIRRDDTKS
jgi:hypothetical protein